MTTSSAEAFSSVVDHPVPQAAVAVVGMSCRFPGAAGPAAFWAALTGAVDAVTGGRGPAPGAFLDRIDLFDPEFFGISPREAVAMDPQQRLVLELGWEALEDAAIVPARLRESETGVFVGAIANDYAEAVEHGGAGAVTQHSLTGLHRSLIANRLSYALRLRGPSLTVDTGQSSSLVAVHLAVQSLLSGECATALAGGVQLNYAGLSLAAAQEFGGFSPDGKCFTFDARANGYVRGEGAGVVVLKRLTDAVAAGDEIHCVILGSAVNNDGGGPRLTVPNGAAQEQVVRQALRRAGVRPAEVGYVELHGTGTRVGDPIEAAALGAAMRGRPAGAPLPVGSVKTNIGHLEAAAGIAGLMKAALCVRHGVLPPSLNFRTPNPAIAFDELNLRVNDELRPWPAGDGARIAGVSSIGVGGTNCHVVLAEHRPQTVGAPAGLPETPAEARRGALGGAVIPWAVSGRTAAARRDQAGRLASHVEASPELAAEDVGRSLAATRTSFESRAVILAPDRDALLAGTAAVASGSAVSVSPARVVEGTAGSLSADRPVFVFPGQGTQWPAMALELLDVSAPFAQRMRECDEAISRYARWSAIEVLRASSTPEGAEELARIEILQPVLFAVMVSLAHLWQACGVRPAAMIGASQGEIAAACVAGALSLDDAAKIVVQRGRVLGERMAGHGGIASIALPEDAVQARLEPWAGRVSVSGTNGPRATTVAGEKAALEQFVEACVADGTPARIVPSTVALHCPEVDAIRDEFFDRVEPVSPHTAAVPLYSTVTGLPLDGAELDLDYWYRNAREAVDFTGALDALLADGYRVFIEISPHPVLTIGAQETFERSGVDAAALISLRRGDGGPDRFAASLAEAYVRGASVDWAAVIGAGDASRVALPTYAFQRQSYWVPTAGGAEDQPVADNVRTVFRPEAASPSPVADGPDSGPDTTAAPDWQPLADLVRAHAAAVSGRAALDDTQAATSFKDLGFDSAMTVELCNRLAMATGLALTTSAVYDHPTPADLARHLGEQSGGGSVPAPRRAPERPRVRRTQDIDDDAIAIVGMACRYPGGVRSPEDLWQLVLSETDAVGDFPDNRGWDLEALYDADGERPGTSYTRSGGFIDGAAMFDPGFFGISPREATAMDPQQRLTLETAWEACERAGIDPRSLRESRTGVFVGAMAQDYGPRLHRAAGGAEGYALTGSTVSVASGRVAYVLGLSGPAVTVDTACSSSLVAVHLAARSLRSGESTLALAGGACVMASPGMFVEFSKQHGLARDGRCKAFSDAADGTAWAEGAGMLLLERLSDARRNGRRVLAVLRGTAINQDGASNGLTAPNGAAQRRVILDALDDAGLTAAQVDALEAHGTGTALGDPVEAQAALAVYGADRPQPLWLGSLKSNIGHSQAAAGVGGVIKTVMALRHGTLARSLHVEAPSSRVQWSAGAVSLLTESRPWPETGRPRRAAVSAFGISGTNAHVILEQAEDDEPEAAGSAVPQAGPHLFVLSARDEGALRARAARLRDTVAEDAGIDSAQLANALATTRTAHEHRCAVVATDRDELIATLDEYLRTDVGDPDGASQETVSTRLVTGTATGRGRTVFVFPGQGSQWERMVAPLMESSPVFAARLRECEEALRPHVDWSLTDVLRGAPGAAPLTRVDVVQPVLWAVMVSLAALWQSAGVRPDAVVGHSQGEIAAATVAGALTLQDAARVAALRSKALIELAGTGAMASIPEPVEQVTARIARWPGRLDVAAVNGPAITVVSGDPEAVTQLVEACQAEDVRARMIPVDYASHCARVEPLHDRLAEVLAPIEPAQSRLAFYSAVTGGRLDAAARLDAEYWYTNLRSTVRFKDAVEALATDGHATFVEVSPHPVLVPGIQETVGDAVIAAGTLRRDHGGMDRFLTSLAQLYVEGVAVDWSACYAGAPRPRVDLPTYPFQRQRYWIDPADMSAEVDSAGLTAVGHPLLGAAVELAGGAGTVYSGRLPAGLDWLADHVVADTVLLPGTAFAELALQAASGAGCDTLDELVLQAPLPLDGRSAVRIQVSLAEPEESGRRAVAVYARRRDDESWVCHATGAASVRTGGAAEPAVEDRGSWPPPGAESIDVAAAYERLAERGYHYGPAFRGLRSLARLGDTYFAEVALEAGMRPERYTVHPALLDAALHGAVLAGEAASEQTADGLRLPFSFTGLRVHAVGADSLRVRIKPAGIGAFALDATDPLGVPVVSIDVLTLRAVDPAELAAAAGTDADRLYRVDWIPVAEPAAPASRSWALVADEAGGPVPGWAPAYPSIAALLDAVAEGSPVPETVLTYCAAPRAAAGIDAARESHRCTGHVLDLVRAWSSAEQLADSRLAVVTRGAVAAELGDDVEQLAGAAVWGLMRSAQSELPGRVVLIDLDSSDPAGDRLGAALATGEPQLAVRGRELLAARLARCAAPSVAGLGALAPWRLDSTPNGGVDSVAAVPAGPLPALDDGAVRVAVRAIGVNFRDVMIAAGMYPGEGRLGCEAAGTVLEVGAGVTDLAVGDRVMGLFPNGAGSAAATDRRYLARIPDGWTFAQAATVPVVFLTAYHALVDLADLQAGETLLLHTATGGVGQAALQLARHLGAAVYATASPGKWAVLRSLGVPDDHIASSRSLAFEETFRDATDGAGVHVVLNSLAREYTDASLRLLRPGGRFIEMGKTDLRDPQLLAGEHPDVVYRPFDLLTVDPDRIRDLLAELTGLFERRVLRPLQVRTWDVRQAPRALRYLSKARHSGKLALAAPGTPDPDGTILITGGTGTLGSLLARHLAESGRARHLLLVSRRGAQAEGADLLREELAALGAQTTIEACDTANRTALDAVLARIPREHPLTAVVHAAGILDDATLGSMTQQQLDGVLRAKADAAWNLHQATAGLDLTAFVLYSSVVGVVGTAGQANYAAANAFLDALAQHRYANGLAATSLAWGYWAQVGGMTGHLSEADRARFARAGSLPLETPEALALFDAALGADHPALVAAHWNLGAMGNGSSAVPALLRGLVRAPVRSANTSGGAVAATTAGGSLADRLAAAPAADRHRMLLDLVRAHAAVVLGHGGAQSIDAGQAFKDMGFDSLASVELRNRLATATGLRLPATLLFDHPAPAVLARGLLERLLPEGAQAADAAPQPSAASTTSNAVSSNAATSHAVSSDAESARPALEPIAVIGIGCRFPGADGPDAFWRLLSDGVDAVGPVPEGRWDPRAYDDPERAVPAHGGFLEGPVDGFDPLFFGIAPREARDMDPQQRLFLEVAWEALEDAGLAGGRLAASRTGVFASSIWHDYAELAGGGIDGISAHSATGRALNMVANRLSYVLGLRGPSMVVDSACSSSLLAVHLACQSLWSGESETAVAGGVNLLLSPATMVALTRFGGLSPDGRCKAFDARADGFGRGEGCGVVVLKPLSRALADGDDIRCVIRGSAANNDGFSNGLTAPSTEAQTDVLREAYRRAGIDPRSVRYVEAHGTGTSLGDPIEASALGAVLGAGRDAHDRLAIGSVKTNLGHLEAAAGIAGLIKAALCVQHRSIVPSLHFDRPNPHIAFDELGLRVAREREMWPAQDAVVAGVSAFGWGGTNVHTVLEAWPATQSGPAPASAPDAEPEPAQLFTLSAAAPTALRELAHRVAGQLDPRDAQPPHAPAVADLVRAANRRARQPYRLAVVGRTAAELREELLRFDEAPDPGPAAQTPPKTAFVFPGQGSQWLGMGRELLAHEPVFRDAVGQCDAAACAHVDWSIRAELEAGPDTSQLARIDVAQPVLFAVSVALAALWRSWGVEPAAVVGHSMGEIAAAHVAGALGLDDAARIICLRSRLLRRVSGQGAMLSAELTLEEAAAAIEGHEDRVSIAVNNSPRSTVLSGDPEPLEGIAARLRAEEVFCRWVKVDVASHSPQMDPLRADLLAALEGIAPRAARVPIYSTVLGKTVDGTDLGPEYWADNLREPVLFSGQIERLGTEGVEAFLEMSAHPILTPAVEQVAADRGFPATALPSLRRDEPDRAVMLRSLGKLFVLGAALPPEPAEPRSGSGPRRTVKLPTYPWQRERYWHPARSGHGAGWSGPEQHVLLGSRLDSAVDPATHYWQRDLDGGTARIAEHRIGGAALLPGAVYVDLALSAAAETAPGTAWELADIVFLEPLTVPDDGVRRVQTVLSETPSGATVQVYGFESGLATRAAEARLVPAPSGPPPQRLDNETVIARAAEELTGAEYYRMLAARGIGYGPAYQGIERIWRGDRESLAKLRVPAAGHPGHRVHPMFLDAALQGAVAPLLADACAEYGTERFVSAGISSLSLFAPAGPEAWAHAVLSQAPDGRHTADVAVFGPDGTPMLQARGVILVKLRTDPAPQASENGAVQNGSASGSVRGELAAMKSGARRLEALEELLRRTVAEVTALPVSRVPRDAPLRGLGIDSAMSLELRNRLEREFGVRLSASLVWNHPTVRELAPFLARKLGLDLDGSGADAAPAAAPARPVRTEPVSNGAAVPDDAAPDDDAALLARELAELSRRMEEI